MDIGGNTGNTGNTQKNQSLQSARDFGVVLALACAGGCWRCPGLAALKGLKTTSVRHGYEGVTRWSSRQRQRQRQRQQPATSNQQPATSNQHALPNIDAA